MINVLAGLAIAIVVFAVTIGVGLTVLTKFSDSMAVCPTDYSTYNSTGRVCQSGTNSSNTTAASGTAYTTVGTTLTGSTNGLGALVTWVGAIIALVVGMLFIGALMGQKQY